MVQLKTTFANVLTFGLLIALVALVGTQEKLKRQNMKLYFPSRKHSHSTSPTRLDEIQMMNINSTERTYHPLQIKEHENLRREFDCSISWVRIPKTATTSIYKLFMGPLESSQAFATTKVNLNTCLTGPGGCDDFWNGNGNSDVTSTWKRTVDAPPYGIKFSQTNNANPKNATTAQYFVSDRCLPSSGQMSCIEYNRQTGSMNYGPAPDRQNKRKEKEPKLIPLQLHRNSKDQVVSENNIVFNIHPNMRGHVGLDVSLFGWLMPSYTMVFSAFRDPVERLISSFHYGISYGANRPGQVKTCHLPNVKAWKTTAASAKANNTKEYNSLMRTYLRSCVDAIDNTYVAFLDPLTKNVSVALDHLEKYVIVGLTSDISGTLERWKNLTLRTCRDHDKYRWIRRALADTVKNSGERLNEGLVGHEDNGDATSSVIATFKETELDMLDADLKDLVRKYTSGDEIIYRRVLDLYEEQRSWDLYYQHNA